jgi:hypothetical protein
MRYFWGLAVGHIYTHKHTAGVVAASSAEMASSSLEPSGPAASAVEAQLQVPQNYETDTEDPQLGFENLQDDYLGEDDEQSEDDGWSRSVSDDEMAVALDDMYGPSDPLGMY